MTLDAKMFLEKVWENTSFPSMTFEDHSNKNRYTPGKINGWNLKITHLERNIIFQTIILRFQPLVFQGVPTEAARPTTGLGWLTGLPCEGLEHLGHGSATGAFKAPWGPCTNATHYPSIQRKKPSGHSKIIQNWCMFFFGKVFCPNFTLPQRFGLSSQKRIRSAPVYGIILQ